MAKLLDGAADGSGQVDGGPGGDSGGEDDLVAGCLQGDGEVGPVGSGPGTAPVVSAMAVRRAW